MTTRWLQPQKHRKCKSSFRFFHIDKEKKDDLDIAQLEQKYKTLKKLRR